MISRRAVLLGLPLVAAGCSGEAVWAPEDQVAAVRYRAPGPPGLVLYTSLNNDTRSGAHTGLMITASERVMFDPAGSFRASGVPERNDVLFGFDDAAEAAYTAFQASEGYHLIRQHIPVSPEIAELALQKALIAGPVAKSACTRATARLLQELPGFDAIRISWFPDNLMRQLAGRPGVSADLVYLTDDEWRADATAAFERDVLGAGQPG